jgi:hypothetical protein
VGPNFPLSSIRAYISDTSPKYYHTIPNLKTLNSYCTMAPVPCIVPGALEVGQTTIIATIDGALAVAPAQRNRQGPKAKEKGRSTTTLDVTALA